MEGISAYALPDPYAPMPYASLERKIENIKKLPQYKNYKVYAGIAGFHVCKDVLDSALERGYFVLKRKGDVVESYIDNLMAS